MGTSFEFASCHLLAEVCKIGGGIKVVLFDISGTSKQNKLGSKLVLQAKVLFKDVTLVHTTDVRVAISVDTMVFWGVNFPSIYTATYQDFFSGSFKKAIEENMEENSNVKPNILFMRYHSSGLKAANILGTLIPELRDSIYVLSAASDGMEAKVYPRIDGSFTEIQEVSNPHTKALVQDLHNIDGSMCDVEVTITCLKVLLFDTRSPRLMFDYLGAYPDATDVEKWGLEGNSCIFLPEKENPKFEAELKTILKNEEESMAAIKNTF